MNVILIALLESIDHLKEHTIYVNTCYIALFWHGNKLLLYLKSSSKICSQCYAGITGSCLTRGNHNYMIQAAAA